jgi:hypothetical protein
MSKRQKVFGVIGLASLLIGLAVGLWPRYIDTVDYTDVSCGPRSSQPPHLVGT